MTGHHALLADLQSRGVEVTAEGQSLRCRGPRGALTPADLDALRSRKAEILAELQQAADPVQANLIGPNTDPILETRHELGAVLIRSCRFGRDIWIVLTEEMAVELRAEEQDRETPRPVLLAEDVALLRGRPPEAVEAVLRVAAAFPGARVIQ